VGVDDRAGGVERDGVHLAADGVVVQHGRNVIVGIERPEIADRHEDPGIYRYLAADLVKLHEVRLVALTGSEHGGLLRLWVTALALTHYHVVPAFRGELSVNLVNAVLYPTGAVGVREGVPELYLGL